MAFAEAAGLTGVVITKLDGTARGGVALGGRLRSWSSDSFHRSWVKVSAICAPSTALNLWRLCWPVVETLLICDPLGLSREQQAAPATSQPRAADGFLSPVDGVNLRQIFDSLTQEQRRNQDLLASLSFALRSFTNLHRFLELVPVVASRLLVVMEHCSFLSTSDGRFWRDQIHLVSDPTSRDQDLLRRVWQPRCGSSRRIRHR